MFFSDPLYEKYAKCGVLLKSCFVVDRVLLFPECSNLKNQYFYLFFYC